MHTYASDTFKYYHNFEFLTVYKLAVLFTLYYTSEND